MDLNEPIPGSALARSRAVEARTDVDMALLDHRAPGDRRLLGRNGLVEVPGRTDRRNRAGPAGGERGEGQTPGKEQGEQFHRTAF